MAGCGLPLGHQPLWGWKLPGRLEPMETENCSKALAITYACNKGQFGNVIPREKRTEGGRKEGRKGGGREGSQERQN